MIRIESLRVFVTVAACGNIRDAARRLGRTASAVSMSLKQLEDHLGGALFETDRKNVLSALGAQIQAVATGAVNDHDRALERIEAIAQGRAGRLKLAAVPSVAAQLLPAILTDVLAAHPGARIELLDTDTASVHMLVETGAVELGIGGRPAPGSGLAFVPLFRDPFRVVCRADSALAATTAPLDWAGLHGQRMIMNNSITGHEALAHLAPGSADALSARNVISLLALVRAGAGITLLPALATRAIGPDLCALHLADASARREVGLILRAHHSESPICAALRVRLTRAVASDALVSTGAAGQIDIQPRGL